MKVKLIYVHDFKQAPPPDRWFMDGVHCLSVAEFSHFSLEKPCVMVLSLAEKAALQFMRTIRCSAQGVALPVFLEASRASKTLLPYFDGSVETVEEAKDKGEAILARLRTVHPTSLQPDSGELLRILTYLYLRREITLTPYRQWTHKSFYTYPLLELMFDEPDRTTDRLDDLCSRKLLRTTALIDRTRHCPKCHGVHLNFVEICANCDSLDITRKPFLHCFTCGKVAPEELFIQQGPLQCPHCRTKLRHIGVDYDRPLENLQCNNCQHTFVEPVVQAHCMVCSTKSLPENLNIRHVHSLELTDLGREAVRTGVIEDLFATLDTINHVSPTFFLNLVEWMLNLCRRFKNEHFTIIGIRLLNVDHLHENLGNQRTIELLDELGKRLRESVRIVDLGTRTGQHMFWMLLPKTNHEQHLVVLRRVLQLKEMFRVAQPDHISFETVSFTAPQDIIPGETARLLLSRLEGSLEGEHAHPQ